MVLSFASVDAIKFPLIEPKMVGEFVAVVDCVNKRAMQIVL